MSEGLEKYGLNLQCTMILEEYCDAVPVFEKMREIVMSTLKKCLSNNGVIVTTVEARIKTEASLAGKLEIKGSKYRELSEITDILGARIVTFYNDDVDKISALIEKLFDIDWENSIDKRKTHDLDSFGYMSLHFICRIPEKLYKDPDCPEINEYKFEVQMRTALQHVWANMYHDTGYKSGVEIPFEYLRSLNRLAGLLELADDEFSRLRSNITDYRRKVEQLVAGGRFDEVPLNGDTFRSYMMLDPFGALSKRIASINQAEIHQSNSLPCLKIFNLMEFKTLGDIEDLKKEYSEDAYQLALSQIGGTDLDIISSTLAIQDLCLVYLLHKGTGKDGFVYFYDTLYGKSDYNQHRAERILLQAEQLPFMKKRA